jgi:hypothetical protein
MAEKESKKYPGHDEGSQKPSDAPDGYNSSATHVPLPDAGSPYNRGKGGKAD